MAKVKNNKLVLNETDIKEQIRDYLDKTGVYNFHILQGIGCEPGLPDRIAYLKNGIVLHIEVKNPNGGIQSVEQKEFQYNMERNNQVYLLIDNVDDLIAAVNHYKKQPGLFIEPI